MDYVGKILLWDFQREPIYAFFLSVLILLTLLGAWTTRKHWRTMTRNRQSMILMNLGNAEVLYLWIWPIRTGQFTLFDWLLLITFVINFGAIMKIVYGNR